jgi:hypothetical protein
MYKPEREFRKHSDKTGEKPGGCEITEVFGKWASQLCGELVEDE